MRLVRDGPFGVWGTPVFTIAVTGLVAAIVGQTVENDDAVLHELLVDVVAAIIGLTFGMFLVVFILITAAGWLGGVVGWSLR